MNNNIKICIIILFIFSLKLSHANNLFESSFENIEFQSNNIVNNKNLHINELKIFSISNILKNILINNHYKKIRNKIDTQFADSLVKNIIIEDEKILSDRYSANIKINYDKDLIINFLRNEKLPYVENLPDNFLTIILDQKNIKKNLFTKENNYYDFLLNNDQDYLNFYKIPNLDINDRFLISPKDIINRNLININKFLKKYNTNNLLLIHSIFDFNTYDIEIYIINNNSFILVENLQTNNLDYQKFFINLNSKTLDVWKSNNYIQNDKVNKIKCLINALNIYELQKINSLIKSISLISDYKLIEIKLYKNLYEISYFGNYEILKRLIGNKSMDINLINNKCEINLK